ncbi:hypothetical protein C8J57DRAFT_1502395 [Mycena rebaudengoi]|nr:hypothetical protein C8J57DRAFT_1502395 [Mycena rebaudengoi]
MAHESESEGVAPLFILGSVLWASWWLYTLDSKVYSHPAFSTAYSHQLAHRTEPKINSMALPQIGSCFHLPAWRHLTVTRSRYGGAFFPKAKHFVITNGRFKSVTNNVVYRAPPNDHTGSQGTLDCMTNLTWWIDFRVTPPRDLILLRTIGIEDGSGTVPRKRQGGSVRRMYSAHIQGSQTIMTAAVYEGDGAEEKWRDEISQYSKLRHPNLFQLYGIVNSAVHAAIFYDGEHLSLSLCQATDPSPVMLLELVPCKYLLQMYRNLHFSTVFFWACMDQEFRDVYQYIASSVLRRRLGWSEYSVWIRSSTGSLCLDLTRPQSDPVPLYPIDGVQAHRPRTSVLELPEDSEIISSMSLAEYHRTCNMYLCQWREVSVSTNVPAKLGSILHICGPRYEDSVEIAYCAPVCGIDDMGWSAKHPILEDKLFGYGWMSLLYLKGTVIMENGWVRINSADVADIYYRRLEYNISGVSWLSWLTQANHIFDRLHITSHFDDYVFVEAVKCWVHILGSPRTLPAGYLFLCSLDEFQAEVPTWFRRPLCPAYWSLEPFGAHRLSAEESRRQGFPEIILRMEVFGRTWDKEVYTGIRQFQEMKGFDPSNREVAVELGCSLF